MSEEQPPRVQRCASCGRAWEDHPGIAATCAQLDAARRALRVIHTWASCEDGVALDPEQVAELCHQTLYHQG